MGSTDSCRVESLPRARAVATVLMVMSCRLDPLFAAPCSLLDLLRHLRECAGDSVATLPYTSFSLLEARQVKVCPILPASDASIQQSYTLWGAAGAAFVGTRSCYRELKELTGG
jgi:hypothetical protein